MGNNRMQTPSCMGAGDRHRVHTGYKTCRCSSLHPHAKEGVRAVVAITRAPSKTAQCQLAMITETRRKEREGVTFTSVAAKHKKRGALRTNYLDTYLSSDIVYGERHPQHPTASTR